KCAPTECGLKISYREAGHRINHLLMKLRDTFARSQTVLREQHGVVKPHRFVKAIAAWIKVNHFEVFAHRTGIKLFPRDVKCDLANCSGFKFCRQAGVKSESTQSAKRRLGRGKCRASGTLDWFV